MIQNALQTYSPQQWLLLFFYYSLLGWMFETTYVSLQQKKFENRGFLFGPQIPLYGSSAVVILFMTAPFKDSPVLICLSGMAGATLAEYVVGTTMEALFKVRYWDYTNFRLNYQGVICLPASLCWGLLSLLLVNVLQPPAADLLSRIPLSVLNIVDVVLLLLFLTDTVLSVKAALELRGMLEALTLLQKQMSKAEAQAAVRLARIKQQMEKNGQEAAAALREGMHETAEAAAAAREEMLETAAAARENAAAKAGGAVMNAKNELDHMNESMRLNAMFAREEMHEKLENAREDAKEKFENAREIFLARRALSALLLKKNRGITSRRFASAMEQIRRYAREEEEKSGTN